jgi:ferric-dicitrate binding protein FerR (iron transport regulator)
MSDLIQRYLDGTLTPEELAELDALLRDPAAAERFASLSRLDADLSSHFREEARLPALPPLPPRRRWAARLALAACLLLLAGAGLVWWSLPPAPSLPLPPDWPRYLVVDVDETVVLPDGSSVELTAGTTATLWPRAVEMREGEGRFDVRPGDERFEVKTPVGRVTVVGTEFQVNVNEEETMNGKLILTVAVMAGLVDVSYDGRTFRLGAGQRGVYGQEERRPRADVTRGVLAEEGTETKLSLRGTERRGAPATEVEIGKDVKVIVDGKPGKLAGLPRGTRVVIEKNDKGVIVSVRAEGVIRAGVVSAVEKDSITIEQRGRDGATKDTLKVAGAAVTVDGKPGKLGDVKAGDRVTLTMSVDGKSVVALTKGAARERRPEGGDRPARPMRAVIEEIDAKAGTITVGGGERKRVLKLAKDVKVTVNDKPGKVEDFKKGDVVALTLSGREPVEVQAIASAPTRRER